jgi:hypothetical protein
MFQAKATNRELQQNKTHVGTLRLRSKLHLLLTRTRIKAKPGPSGTGFGTCTTSPLVSPGLFMEYAIIIMTVMDGQYDVWFPVIVIVKTINDIFMPSLRNI